MMLGIMRKTEQQEAIRLAEQWKFEKGKIKSPPPPAESSDKIPGRYFITLRRLAEKCTSASANDLAWCEAYIAGVLDTLAGRNDPPSGLANDAQDARLCLREMGNVSLGQARQAVGKIITQMQEENSPITLNSAASNSVVAGVLVHLCQ
jgi:hypothetical protein